MNLVFGASCSVRVEVNCPLVGPIEPTLRDMTRETRIPLQLDRPGPANGTSAPAVVLRDSELKLYLITERHYCGILLHSYVVK